MLSRPLLAVAGLSAATGAFLLPPSITSHHVEIVDALPAKSASSAQTQSLQLDCPGCPLISEHLKEHEGMHKHHVHYENHLELEFSIDQSVDHDRLMLNGFELYPDSNPFTSRLVAPQVSQEVKHKKPHPKHHKDKKAKKEHEQHDITILPTHNKFRPGQLGKAETLDQLLGFGLQVHPVQKTADENLDLVVVDLQIIEVGSVFVDGLSNVRVHLIRAPSNELMIAKIEEIAPESSRTNGDCQTMLCRWKAFIADKLSKMKPHGCAGMTGGKMAGMMGGKMGGKMGDAHPHAPPPGHHDEHYGMFNRPNGWSLFFRKVTSHIILPVLVGIVAGVTVAVVSMLVGTILVGLFRKFVRGQSFFPQHRCRLPSGPRLHKAAKMEAAVDEEKSALMEDQEILPPSYHRVEVTHAE